MKRLLPILLFIFLATSSYAVQALTDPMVVTQPDGSKLTVLLKGDENFHFFSTTDQYILLKDSRGYFVYAVQDNTKEWKASTIIAHNAESRNDAEKTYLKSLQPQLPIGEKLRKKIKLLQQQRSTASGMQKMAKSTSVSSPHYLVILVNFSDKSFNAANDSASFANMTNGANYTTNGATGSVRQYFSDNSLGNFAPVFDVRGPVTLSQPMAYYGGNNANGQDQRPQEMIFEACQLLDNTVNFAQYDADNDGYVDNVYVIYAGLSEASGGTADCIWPHAWAVNNNTLLDNVKIGRYACSNELKSNLSVDGIGVMCHEFSHVLGLPDFYDTDYATNGKAYGTGNWDLMGSGCYNNATRTPPYYSAIERQILNWGSGTLLTTANSYTLNPVNSNEYYRINTPVPNEYFLIENRQKSGWDYYIPSHGMMVYHVDETPAYYSYWYNNMSNAYQSHPCMDIVSASGTKIVYDGTNYTAYINNIATIPFPGSTGKTILTDNTVPNLRTWSGLASGKPITNIVENGSVISFNLLNTNETLSAIALPGSNLTSTSFTANWETTSNTTYTLNVYQKSSPSGTGNNTQDFTSSTTVTPSPTNWSLNNVIVTDATNYNNSVYYGNALPSIRLSATDAYIRTENYPDAISSFSFRIKGGFASATNPGNSILLIEASADNGTTWDRITEAYSISVNPTTLSYNLNHYKGYRMLRFTLTEYDESVFVDDITVNYGGLITTTNILQNQATTGNSLNVTSLNPAQTYYYAVVASNSNENILSNEIAVQLPAASTLVNQTTNDEIKVYASNESIIISSPKNGTARFYNSLGQLIDSRSIHSGINQIPTSLHGIVFVKIDQHTYQLILR